MEIIKEVLKKYKNIALVGASKDLTKTSSVVMKYLQDYGFKKLYVFKGGWLEWSAAGYPSEDRN